MKKVSWIIVNKETGKPLMETFNKSTAYQAINSDQHNVIPKGPDNHEAIKPNGYLRSIY